MNVDLFLRRVPSVVKELIGREAAGNHRSINQEAIALLEEALLSRVGAHHVRRKTALESLQSYADSVVEPVRASNPGSRLSNDGP